jgi:hypothetical protein
MAKFLPDEIPPEPCSAPEWAKTSPSEGQVKVLQRKNEKFLI